MNTKKEIIDKIYYLLWEDQTSTVFDKEWEVAPKCNEVIDKICRCEVKNILTDTKIKGWILDFLYEERTIKLPRSKRLNADLDTDSTTITLSDVDDLPTTGFIEIEWNVISYWGIDDDWLLIKIGWVNWYHWQGAEVHFAYQMPSKVLKPADIYDTKEWYRLRFMDFREYKWFLDCYTLKPSNGKKFAIFYNRENPVTISYLKRLDEMTTDDDECWLPDDYWKKIVPYIVAWELLIDTSEVDKWQKLLQIWYWELEDMYSFYATPNKQFRKRIKVSPMRSSIYDVDDLPQLRSN